MNFGTIKEMARKNEVATYFKALYQHSVQALEKLSEEQIKDIVSSKKDQEGWYGQCNHICFDGTSEGTVITPYIIYADGVGYEAEPILVKSSFNYRGLIMELYFEGMVMFYSGFDDEDENLDEDFLKSLTVNEYLSMIFGGELLRESGIYNETWKEVCFCVSSKWFEET